MIQNDLFHARSGAPSRPALRSAALGAVCLLWVAAAVSASDWPQWRGVTQLGVSAETGLPSTWSVEGENLAWRTDFIGRSTPVVMGGRVFASGRAGTEVDRREIVAAFDAETGEQLWEVNIPTHLTTVPYNRAGWGSVTGDAETGYIYFQGMGGPFYCIDRDGNVVWKRSLYEEFGRFSGYGGRTHTPLVDEDQVIINIINGSWGPLGAPRHRYAAFDKKTGDLRWMSTPGGMPYDRNTQSNGSVAVVDGQRLYIAGNADGHIYALQARTGELVWEFELSKRGINSSPLVVGNTVYVGHSEENIDAAVLGRTIAIDARGTGDITKSHELWRRDIKMGFPSPMYHDGTLFVMDNSANLYALNPESGETLGEFSVGTVGKSAPTWADGKIYVTEVNGRFHILEYENGEFSHLDEEFVAVPDGRYAEIYGSAAVAYGRVFFTSEEGIYALANKDAAFEVEAAPAPSFPDEGAAGPLAKVLVVPADVTVDHGDTVQYSLMGFDAKGRPVDGQLNATWSMSWSEATSEGSVFGVSIGQPATEADAPVTSVLAGTVSAKVGEITASSRIRAFPALPYRDDFSGGAKRPHWLGAGRYEVSELDGEGVLEKPVAPRGLLRSMLFVGPDSWSDYTIQVDLRGGQKGRRRTDGGLVNSGYILDILGIKQEIQIRSWQAVLRMAVTEPFEWEMDTWYTMKLKVQQQGDKAMIYGKVWKRGEDEPADWTITAEDPLPIRNGAPAVQAYSPASMYFDNLQITSN